MVFNACWNWSDAMLPRPTDGTPSKADAKPPAKISRIMEVIDT
jgi:hypothetical protein